MVLKFPMKHVACILKAPITVEYWMGIRIHPYCLCEGFIDQWGVVAVPDHICDDPPVIKIQDRAEIDFVLVPM